MMDIGDRMTCLKIFLNVRDLKFVLICLIVIITALKAIKEGFASPENMGFLNFLVYTALSARP